MLDPGIREALFLYLDYNYGKHRTFEEVPINTSRADIYAVTDRGLIGFEIKSDNDSYTRLSSQIKNYDLYFDCNYLVIGKSTAKAWKSMSLITGESSAYMKLKTVRKSSLFVLTE